MLKELTRIHRRTLTLTVALLVLCAATQGAAYAAGVHSCAPGPAANPGVKAIKTNTSCSKAQYVGDLVAVVRGTSPYANRTWKGRKTHGNGHAEFIFTTVGHGPVLKVWVLY
jgi:hypothetical protein